MANGLFQTVPSAPQEMVMGFLLFEPMGLVGVWERIKRYFMAWPFKY